MSQKFELKEKLELKRKKFAYEATCLMVKYFLEEVRENGYGEDYLKWYERELYSFVSNFSRDFEPLAEELTQEDIPF